MLHAVCGMHAACVSLCDERRRRFPNKMIPVLGFPGVAHTACAILQYSGRLISNLVVY